MFGIDVAITTKKKKCLYGFDFFNCTFLFRPCHWKRVLRKKTNVLLCCHWNKSQSQFYLLSTFKAVCIHFKIFFLPIDPSWVFTLPPPAALHHSLSHAFLETKQLPVTQDVVFWVAAIINYLVVTLGVIWSLILPTLIQSDSDRHIKMQILVCVLLATLSLPFSLCGILWGKELERWPWGWIFKWPPDFPAEQPRPGFHLHTPLFPPFTPPSRPTESASTIRRIIYPTLESVWHSQITNWLHPYKKKKKRKPFTKTSDRRSWKRRRWHH